MWPWKPSALEDRSQDLCTAASILERCVQLK